ncbi:hypothetical protein ABEB36_011045 [Hypothenemus hampei]|uniref:Uncharacterized protein n=1 Tax=Hypothenemus hampei TaxID=57062 RepID=A0ABD1EE92_HYPHA
MTFVPVPTSFDSEHNEGGTKIPYAHYNEPNILKFPSEFEIENQKYKEGSLQLPVRNILMQLEYQRNLKKVKRINN